MPSLVGSEMCIRDSPSTAKMAAQHCEPAFRILNQHGYATELLCHSWQLETGNARLGLKMSFLLCLLFAWPLPWGCGESRVVGGINDANLNFQLLLQLSIQNIWASIQNVWCAQHSAQLSYILYGDFFNSEGSRTKYVGLRSLIHFVWALLSHTFCMGVASTLGAQKGHFPSVDSPHA